MPRADFVIAGKVDFNAESVHSQRVQRNGPSCEDEPLIAEASDHAWDNPGSTGPHSTSLLSPIPNFLTRSAWTGTNHQRDGRDTTSAVLGEIRTAIRGCEAPERGYGPYSGPQSLACHPRCCYAEGGPESSRNEAGVAGVPSGMRCSAKISESGRASGPERSTRLKTYLRRSLRTIRRAACLHSRKCFVGACDNGSERKIELKIPEEIKHEWKARVGSAIPAHDCKPCGAWTGNLPLYKNDVCPAKDRRKSRRRSTDK